MLRQPYAVRGGYRHILSGTAWLGDADSAPAQAQVVAPDAAVMAFVAVERRVDSDAVAFPQASGTRPGGHYHPGDAASGRALGISLRNERIIQTAIGRFIEV